MNKQLTNEEILENVLKLTGEELLTKKTIERWKVKGITKENLKSNIVRAGILKAIQLTEQREKEKYYLQEQPKEMIKLMEMAKESGYNQAKKDFEVKTLDDQKVQEALVNHQFGYEQGYAKGRQEEKEKVKKAIDEWYKKHCKNNTKRYTFVCMPDTLRELKRILEKNVKKLR